MKGALLKEFYLWKTTRFYFPIYGILVCVVVAITTRASAEMLPMFYMLASVIRAFTEDRKTGWAEYARCLPTTAAQRITAKYIFTLAELGVGILFSLLLSLQSVYHARNLFGTANDTLTYIISLSYDKVLANHLIYTAIFAVGFSVFVPLSFKLKQRRGEKSTLALRIVFWLGLFVVAFFIAFSQSFALLKFKFDPADVLCEKHWLCILPAVVAAASIAASWFLCVWFESINNKTARKKLQVKAVVFACIAVAALGIAAGGFAYEISSTEGFFDLGLEDDYTADNEPDKTDTYRSDPEKSREKMFEYIDAFCAGGYNNEVSFTDFGNRLKDLGAVKQEDSIGNFYMPDGTLSVTARDELGTDIILKINVKANPEATEVKEATDVSLKTYTEQFFEGMTESELIALFKKLGLCPASITEEPQEMTRKYKVELHIKKFNYEKSADAEITIYTQNSVVSFVEYYAR